MNININKRLIFGSSLLLTLQLRKNGNANMKISKKVDIKIIQVLEKNIF